jgi:hypothetical protein
MEEMSKLEKISAYSAAVGAMGFALAMAVTAVRETSQPIAALVSLAPVAVVIVPLVLVVAFVFVLPTATIVHLALGRAKFPRIFLLPPFLAIGYLVGSFAGGDRMLVVSLCIAISFTAWALYCFGRWRLYGLSAVGANDV